MAPLFLAIGITGERMYIYHMIKIALKEGVVLQEHQKDAVDKMKKSDALLLFHGLGSGKTLSSIAATEKNKNVTVITPASLRGNYKKELDKFVDDDTKSKYTIGSYEGAVKGDVPFYGDALVVDEAHRLANQSTKRSKRIIGMAKNYNKRIALTGTPFTNHPSEFSSIMQFLSPGDKTIPADKAEFNRKFLKTETVPVNLFQRFRGIKPGTRTSVQNIDEFKKAIKGKVHYYETDRTHYPKVNEEVVKVPMSKEQHNLYKTVTKTADPILAYKVRKNIPMTNEEMKRMNSFMSAARQVSNVTNRYGYESPTPKLERVVDDFMTAKRSNSKFKGVIYSNYKRSGVDILAEKLQKAGVNVGKFTGGMSDTERSALVDQYNKDKIHALLVSSAGTEGLDLKGTGMVQVVEPHWNKAKIDQVIGRAVRYKSHEHLPEAERHVAVKRYHSVLPNKKHKSADEYLDQMSSDKDKINQMFMQALRESKV